VKIQKLRASISFSLSVSVLASMLMFAGTSGAQAAEFDPISYETGNVFTLLNAARADAGVPPLVRDTSLDTQAQSWALDMTANGLRHSGYMAPGAAYTSENIASGPINASDVTTAWLGSVEHRENMLSGIVQHVGIGYDPTSNMWVENFALYWSDVTITTSTPVISGTPAVGEMLSADHGVWTPTPDTWGYQWSREATAIAGATGPTYTLTDADLNHKISVRAFGYKNGFDDAAMDSASTVAVEAGTMSATSDPSVAGTAQEGQALTAAPGTWPSTSALTYQWLSNGNPIRGATSDVYTIGSADVGAQLAVSVTASQLGYTTLTRTSPATSPVLPAILPLTATPTPTITGSAAVGQALTVTTGDWAPAPVSLSYQWLRGSDSIAGATGASYILTAADQGKPVSVSVTGILTGYATETQTSSPTAEVLAPRGTVVRLSGSNSFSTSAGVSHAGFVPGVPVVYIANSRFVPAALAGAAVASKNNAPILMVDSKSVSSVVRAELARLRPGRVVVLGSTAAVSASVMRVLTRYSHGRATRLSGANPYATSVAISRANFSRGVPVVYIANGSVSADAVTAASIAGKSRGPILFTATRVLPWQVRVELARLRPGRIVVLGGAAAVSAPVMRGLARYAHGRITRWGGANRWASSAAISRANFAAGVPVVYIANGVAFSDALSGAPVAGKMRAPILMVSTTVLPREIRSELARLRPGRIVVLGNTAMVNAALARQLDAYIR
jgi:putative cell wall-binding protein